MEDDIAELDRLDEENRLDDLQFADDRSSGSSAGDAAEQELHDFINPGHMEDNMTGLGLDESFLAESTRSSVSISRRSVAERYTAIVSESIEREAMQAIDLPADSHSLEAEVFRLVREVHQKNHELEALKIQLNHKSLQVKALSDREHGYRADCESARIAHAAAEQARILLEHQLNLIAGVPNGLSLDELRGQLLQMANRKIQEMGEQLDECQQHSQRQLSSLQEQVDAFKARSQALSDECALLCHKEAMLTVTHSALLQDSKTQFHRKQVEFLDAEKKILESQARCGLLAEQNKQLSEERAKLLMQCNERDQTIATLKEEKLSLEQSFQALQSEQLVITQNNLQLQALVDSFSTGHSDDLLTNALGELDRLKHEKARAEEQLKRQIDALRTQMTIETDEKEELKEEFNQLRRKLQEREGLLLQLGYSLRSENTFVTSVNISSRVSESAAHLPETFDEGSPLGRMVYASREVSTMGGQVAKEIPVSPSVVESCLDTSLQGLRAVPEESGNAEAESPAAGLQSQAVDESILLGSPLQNISIYSDQQSVDDSDAGSWLVPNRAKLARIKAENRELKDLLDRMLKRAMELGVLDQLDGTALPVDQSETSTKLAREGDADQQLIHALKEAQSTLAAELHRSNEQIAVYKTEMHHLQELCETNKEVGRQEAALLFEHKIHHLEQQLENLRGRCQEAEAERLALQSRLQSDSHAQATPASSTPERPIGALFERNRQLEATVAELTRKLAAQETHQQHIAERRAEIQALEADNRSLQEELVRTQRLVEELRAKELSIPSLPASSTREGEEREEGREIQASTVHGGQNGQNGREMVELEHSVGELRAQLERLQDDWLSVSQQKSDLGGMVTRLRLQVEEQLAEISLLQSENGKLREQLDNLQEACRRCEEEKAMLVDEKTRMDQDRIEQVSLLSEQMPQYTLELAGLEEKVRRLAEEKDVHVCELQVQVDELTQKLQLAQNAAAMHSAVPLLQAQINDLQSRRSALSQELLAMEGEREAHAKHISTLMESRAAALRQCEQVAAEASEQEALLQTLESSVAHLAKLKQEMEAAHSSQVGTQQEQQLEEYESRSSLLRQEISELDVLWMLKNTHVQKVTSVMDQLRAEHDSLLDQLQALRTQRQELERDLAAVRDSAEAASSVDGLRTVKQEYEQEIQSAREALAMTQAEHEALRAEILTQQTVLANVTLSIQSSSQELSALEEKVSALGARHGHIVSLLQATSKELAALQTQKQEMAEQVIQQKAQRDEIAAQLIVQTSELSAVEHMVSTCKLEHKDMLHHVGQSSHLAQELQSLHERVQQAEHAHRETLAELHALAQVHEALQQHVAELTAQNVGLSNQAIAAQTRIQELTLQLESRSSALEKAQADSQDMHSLYDRMKTELTHHHQTYLLHLTATNEKQREMDQLLLQVQSYERQHRESEQKYQEILDLYQNSSDIIAQRLKEVNALQEEVIALRDKLSQAERERKVLQRTNQELTGMNVGDLGALQGMVRQLQHTMTQQDEETESALQQLRKEHEEELQQVKGKLRRQFKKYMEEKEHEYNARLASLQSEQLQLQREAWAKEEKALRAAHALEMNEAIASLEGRLQALTEEVETSRRLASYPSLSPPPPPSAPPAISASEQVQAILNSNASQLIEQQFKLEQLEAQLHKAQEERQGLQGQLSQQRDRLVQEEARVLAAQSTIERMEQELGAVRAERDRCADSAQSLQKELDASRTSLQHAVREQQMRSEAHQQLQAQHELLVKKQQQCLLELEEAKRHHALSSQQDTETAQEWKARYEEAVQKQTHAQQTHQHLQARYQDLQEHFDKLLQEHEEVLQSRDVNKYHRHVQTDAWPEAVAPSNASPIASPPAAVPQPAATAVGTRVSPAATSGVVVHASLDHGPWTLRVDPKKEGAVVTVDMVPAVEVHQQLQQQKAKLMAKFQHKLEKLQAQHNKEKDEILTLVRRECLEIMGETQRLLLTKKDLQHQQEQLFGIMVQIDQKLTPMLHNAPSLRDSIHELRQSVQDKLRSSTELPKLSSSVDAQNIDSILGKLTRHAEHLGAAPSARQSFGLDSVSSAQPPVFPASQPMYQPAGFARTASSSEKPITPSGPATTVAAGNARMPSDGIFLPQASSVDVAHSRRYYAANTVTPPSSLPRNKLATTSSQPTAATGLGPSPGSGTEAGASVLGRGILFPEMLSPEATEGLLQSMSQRTSSLRK